MGGARSQRRSAGVDHRDSEKPARRLWPDCVRSAVEEKTCGGFRGWRHPNPNHPQAYGAAGAFRGGRSVSNSFLAFPSGNRGKTRRTRASAREGEFSHHAKVEAVPDAVSDAGKGIVRVCRLKFLIERRSTCTNARNHSLLRALAAT